MAIPDTLIRRHAESHPLLFRQRLVETLLTNGHEASLSGEPVLRAPAFEDGGGTVRLHDAVAKVGDKRLWAFLDDRGGESGRLPGLRDGGSDDDRGGAENAQG